MSGLLMLDTNAVSAVVGGHAPALARRLFLRGFCISVVTEAEIRFGLARRPHKAALRASLERMLSTIDIRPWTSATARRYGPLRAELGASDGSREALELREATSPRRRQGHADCLRQRRGRAPRGRARHGGGSPGSSDRRMMTPTRIDCGSAAHREERTKQPEASVAIPESRELRR